MNTIIIVKRIQQVSPLMGPFKDTTASITGTILQIQVQVTT